MEWRCVLLSVLLLAVWVGASSPPQIVSVVWDSTTSTYSVVNGTADKWVAWANYTDQIDENGWTFLKVVTNENEPDAAQAYAAGLAEGYLTTNIIYQYWVNTVQGYCQDEADADYCDRLWNFLNTNQQFIKNQTILYGSTDPYWHQVDLVMQQLQGLQDGYQDAFPIDNDQSNVLTDFGFLFLQLGGDLEDLEMALGKTVNLKHMLGSGSCSALIKLLPGNTDMYISHVSWNTYQSMNRVLKKYEFHYHQLDDSASPLIPGLNMTFSSYAGCLFSLDDYYLISSGLATIETTIGNSNPALWQYVTPTTLFEFLRSMIANRLGTDGDSWTTIFSQLNSGTYNNEWMVLDYKLYQPNQVSLSDNLLWVLEQLPGTIVREDRTDTLREQTYWASYNAPYFPEIFNLSGCAELVEIYGDWYSYDKTPRALMFARDHTKVVDLDTMTSLMRYNDYTNDPLSVCNCTPPYSAENAISARSDLNPANGTYEFSALGHRAHGGIDMKLTSYDYFQELQFIAIGGPTYDQVPPFQWSTFDQAASTSHLGQPDLWQFEPVLTDWE